MIGQESATPTEKHQYNFSQYGLWNWKSNWNRFWKLEIQFADTGIISEDLKYKQNPDRFPVL